MDFTNKEIDLDFSVVPEKQKNAKKYQRKVIRKLKIAFFLLLIVVLLTYYFLTIKGGRFASFNYKLIFASSLLFSFILAFVLLYIHLNLDFKLKHYVKYYQFYDVVHFLLLTVLIIVFLQMFVFKTASISGPSMEPTLTNGDEVFIMQAVRKYKINDVVVIDASKYNSNGKDEYYVKRIKGLPGQTFILEETERADKYYIVLDDEYLKDIKGDIIIITSDHYNNLKDLQGKIPKNSYFLLGDNTTNSTDSRKFGFVNEEDLLGKVNFRVWRKFGIIR